MSTVEKKVHKKKINKIHKKNFSLQKPKQYRKKYNCSIKEKSVNGKKIHYKEKRYFTIV